MKREESDSTEISDKQDQIEFLKENSSFINDKIEFLREKVSHFFRNL